MAKKEEERSGADQVFGRKAPPARRRIAEKERGVENARTKSGQVERRVIAVDADGIPEELILRGKTLKIRVGNPETGKEMLLKNVETRASLILRRSRALEKALGLPSNYTVVKTVVKSRRLDRPERKRGMARVEQSARAALQERQVLLSIAEKVGDAFAEAVKEEVQAHFGEGRPVHGIDRQLGLVEIKSLERVKA